MPFFANRTRVIGEAALAADKPVMIALTPGAAAEAPRRALREIGQFYFDRSEDALRVLALVAEYDARRAAPSTLRDAARRPARCARARAPDGALTESEVKRLLAAYGVQVAAETLTAPTPEAAAAAAGALGAPRSAQGGVASNRPQERRRRRALARPAPTPCARPRARCSTRSARRTRRWPRGLLRAADDPG